MKGQIFTIIFRETHAFLCPEVAMDFTQVKLPPVAAQKGFDPPAAWKIRVIGHNREQNSLYVEVLQYGKEDQEFPEYQERWFDELMMIETINFRNIDTTAMLRSLNKAGLPEYRPIPLPPGEEWDDDELDEELYDEKDEENDSQADLQHSPKSPQKRLLEEIFTVPIKRLRFKLGGVEFSYMMKDYWREIDFEITNYDIREEFDAVKNYFANVLKTKKITVTARVEITDGEITEKSARSPEIERIDQKLIDNVKFEFVKKTMKKRIQVEVDKSLFTMDEYFDTFSEEKPRAGAFFKDEYDLLENLLQITNTRHYKNLRYLSAKHAHHIMKLRFVHKPFSFIFLIEGERNYHIIWETLDTTEATWIWHSEKNINSLKNSLRKVEDIINVVKVQGKTVYINTNEDPFRRVFHDYSDLVEGFVRWKGELENYLT